MLNLRTTILSLSLMCLSTTVTFALDFEGKLESDFDVNRNQESTTGTVSVDGGGHSINGNGFSGIKNTQNSAAPVEIKNVGGFNLTETENTGANTVLKFDENKNAVRYEITDTGSANGFSNNSSTPALKTNGSFVSSKSGLNIENSVIKNNTTEITGTGSIYGGALYNGNSTNGMTVKNSFVTGNYVEIPTGSSNSIYGGAICTDSRTTLNIIDSYITNNYISSTDSTNTRGGAVHAGGSVSVQGSYFGNNSVSGKNLKTIP